MVPKFLQYASLLMCLLSSAVLSVDIISKGTAPIIQGNIALAREKAIEDAVRNAALQVGARVRSIQRYQQGIMAQDDIELTTQAQIDHVRILSEQIKEHQLHVEAKVTLGSQQDCAHSTKSHYKRTFAVAEFGVQYPKDLTLGQLRNVGSVLGNRFTSTLNAHDKLTALNIQEAPLYRHFAQAPRTLTNRLPLTDHFEMAKQMGTQFVVSAVIQSMGMINPTSLLGINNGRTFELMLYVHDGISGSLIQKHPVSGQAVWHFNRHRRVRMGSSEFWDSDYGRLIDTLFKQASLTIAQAVECLPYMAQIIDANQHQIRLAAGTLSGLKPGDKLSLVRKTTQYGLQLEPLTELKRTYIEATIKQVQPNYSIAELDNYNDSRRYAIQRGDLVVKW